jgi:hypothetical protein
MKFSFFYAIVALFATAQAVSVRTPEPDVAAENDPTVPKCKWPLSVSPHTTVSLTAFIFFF